MNTAQLIRDAKAEAIQFCRDYAGAIVRWTKLSNSSSAGDADGAEGWQADSDEGSQSQLRVRRTEPWGIHGRPVAGVLAALVRPFGSAVQNILVGIWTNRYGRQDLAAGETQVYCAASDAELYLDKDGNALLRATDGKNVTVTASTAGKVTLSVAQLTGAVELGPNPTLEVLCYGALDSMGVRVSQALACTSGGPGKTIVKAG